MAEPRRRAPRAAPSSALVDDVAALSIRCLRGVGPKLADKLAGAGLAVLQDLWFHLPLRYEDRTRVVALAELQHGVAVQVDGRVEAVERGFRFRPQLRVAVGDDSGHGLILRFFHFNAAQVAQFSPGRRVRLYGEPRQGNAGFEMVHPSYRFIDDVATGSLGDALDPVYPTVAGIGSPVLARLITAALDRLPPSACLELLPDACWHPWVGFGLREALLYVHRPPAHADLAQLAAGQHPAQRRLAVEELVAHHLSLRRQRLDLQRQGARPIRVVGGLAQQLTATLPFGLTLAQQRVLEQIVADISRPQPMLRLVQGDVGSGKTVVAALAALYAIEDGRQVALVAPTELLAEQHFVTLQRWLQPIGVSVCWLAGKIAGKARSRTLDEIASGRASMVVGTHALLQSGVCFADLALCIVDEQHRFGVHQRLALRDKGRDGNRLPHQLVMTATPIPRTLAMTAYADLDVSRIDALPPGRTPVRTVALSNSRRPEVVERIRAVCAAGAQAYWVCVLIEESDEVQAQAAQSTYEQLHLQLPELRIGLVHGRLKPKDKQAVMQAFKAGDLHVLVATTVVEVGVDVPNASLMLIENAERLGLAQLHQLRGRVGRGAAVSSCVLMYQGPLSQLAKARLATMRETNDGFVIAERDLALRGPGEVLGTRQTGLAQFRIADLQRDGDLLDAVAGISERALQHSALAVDGLIRRWVGSAVRYAGV